MALVARAVASAPSTTVALHDDAGAVVAEATVAHDPNDPDSWWVALQRAYAEVADPAPEPGVASISVAASPGVVVLDAAGRAVWVGHAGAIDAAPDAGWLAGQLPDGADGWVAAVGRAPAADDAISALSWLHRSEPDVWARLARVASPTSFLVARLTGRLATSPADAATTGWWSTVGAGPRLDLLAIVDRDRDWSGAVPEVVATGREVGTWQGRPVVLG